MENHEALQQHLQGEAKKRFRPEFLNRVEEVIVFRQLQHDQLASIVDIEISKVQERLDRREITLVYDDSVRDFLIEQGYTPEYGARQIRRFVERLIEDPLAEEILRNRYPAGSVIRLKPDNKKLLFFIEQPPRPEMSEEEEVPPEPCVS